MDMIAATGIAAAGLIQDEPVAYRAQVSPAAIAVLDLASGVRLTYAELDDRIAATAAALLARGLEPGDRVAVLGRNSAAQVALALACQRVGASFVPLNWRLAAPELAALLADCTPRLLLAAAEFGDAIANVALPGLEILDFEAFAAEPATPAASRPEARTAPFALLYTSGTTGKPKGVVVTRANAFFAALNFALVGAIGPTAVVLSDLPLFHTIGLIAVMRTTLMLGGTLVLTDRFDAARTLAVIADPGLGVTHYFGVPRIAATLREQPGFDGRMLAGLTAMFLGGAPLPQSLVDAYLADGVPLVNGYGMSEAGTAIHMPIDPDLIRRHTDAIGIPAPLMEIRIVGIDNADVAPGGVGELWLRGPAVTPGYWHKPAETAAAFTDGWFRSGDLVRRGEDGLVRLVDRLKQMYITGGENVYPAEVENVLLAHPDIADATVIGVPDARWGEVGAALVVSRSGTLDATALGAYCAARLARYKCPARFSFVTTIPRTASGKVQKHLLRDSL